MNTYTRDGSISTRRLRWPRRLCGGRIRTAVDVATTAYVGAYVCVCPPSPNQWTRRGIPFQDLWTTCRRTTGLAPSTTAKRTRALKHYLTATAHWVMTSDDTCFTPMKEEVHAHISYEDLSDVSVFKSEPKGSGLYCGRLLKKPQHEFTLARQ